MPGSVTTTTTVDGTVSTAAGPSASTPTDPTGPVAGPGPVDSDPPGAAVGGIGGSRGPQAGGAGGLARTGADSGTLGGFALVLLSAGALALLAARRRSR